MSVLEDCLDYEEMMDELHELRWEIESILP